MARPGATSPSDAREALCSNRAADVNLGFAVSTNHVANEHKCRSVAGKGPVAPAVRSGAIEGGLGKEALQNTQGALGFVGQTAGPPKSSKGGNAFARRQRGIRRREISVRQSGGSGCSRLHFASEESFDEVAGHSLLPLAWG